MWSTVTAFERVGSDGAATAIDPGLWTALPHTEIGSTRIVPVDARGRWRTVDPDAYRSDERPRGYRVTGTAGCDLAGNPIPGPFFEGLAHVFRWLWMTEPASMEAAKTVMSAWVVAGATG